VVPTKANLTVPYFDLTAQYRDLRDEIRDAIDRVCNKASFILGEEVERFEQAFAKYCGVKHCVALNSGTSALHLALLAAGIGQGDEVITTANTFIATVEAIIYTGATPVFADIDPATANIDPEKIEQAITKRTRAVIPVHLYGRPANLEAITKIASDHSFLIIEDACQAHGASFQGKRVGGFGHSAAFSFYPGKNLGACGEAGAITTNDEEMAKRMKMIRDHGQAKKYYHDIEGYNGRLDSIQAGWLSVKLRHLAKWNESRRNLAHRYHELLTKVKDSVVIPVEASWTKGVYHLYVVRVQDREALQARLGEVGIGTGIHYPIPLHQQKAYKHLGYKTGDFPVTERVAREIVSLPLFPQLLHSQQDQVASAVKEFLAASVVATR